MAEDLPKPLAQATARIAAERSKTERWFIEAIKEAKTEKDCDETLLGYVFHRFVSFAQETCNAYFDMNVPAADLRDTLADALSTIVDQTLRLKHYRRDTTDNCSAVSGWKIRFTDLAMNDVYSSDEWHQIQKKLDEYAEWQAKNDPTHSLIGRLSQDALVRIEAETAAFMAEYKPKLEREANKSGIIHDAELIRELVIHQFNLVSRECMAVCASVEEFDDELRGEIARFVRHCLTQYEWLAEPMLQELDLGFTLFVMRMNLWATIPEKDRATVWHVGAFTGEALSHAALRLLAEAWKYAAEGKFQKLNEVAEEQSTRAAPETAVADSARDGLGANLDSPSGAPDPVRPRRTPDFETSRDRLALVDALARELATIKQDLRRYCTAEDLKQKHPHFILWEHIDNGELGELAAGAEFAPKAYAENLTLRRFGISSRETLKKDRKKLRQVEKSKRP